MDMLLIDITNDIVFNFFFSVVVNMLFVLAPLFAGLTLLNK